MKVEKLNESVNASEKKKVTFHVGQKVLYRGKETEIVKIDNDPEYGVDILIKNPNWNGEDNRFENIWVGDKVEVIEENLTEDISKDALNPGIAMGSPTAVDCRNYIKEAIDALSEEKYRNAAVDQLTYYAKTIIKSKQNFEDFDAYWAERYPAMLNLLDAQLEMIPREVIAGLSPDVVEEDLSDRIRKGKLDHNDTMDTFTAEEDGVQIQLQDREKHTHEFGSTTNQWGKSFVGDPLNKQPKVATQTWGRVWKNGKFDKSFEGPKYQVRAEMAKYLDNK